MGSQTHIKVVNRILTLKCRAARADPVPIFTNHARLLQHLAYHGGVDSAGTSWDGVTWENVRWDAVTWENVTWEGFTWEGVTWEGVTWESVTWQSTDQQSAGAQSGTGVTWDPVD